MSGEDGRGEDGKRQGGGGQSDGAPSDGARSDGARSAGAPANREQGGGQRQLTPEWPTRVPASRTARLAVYLLLLALGVVTAAAGALVQSGWFPGGLVLALAGAVGLFWGGAKLCRTRVGAAAPGVGWVVTVFALTSPRPEGDFVFGAGIGSYVFLLGGVLAAVMCATIALPAPPVPGPKYR
ncbi:DUF6113 family protein [Streptomyces marispadix]|uniref:DUF6113 family protein n=1 Tax=Streptomyces marispadix TaxID=2922868 RepID=A0ABS9T245_9ACTN|nr:DUF6113 family protein [Streptomyces marispadix]MCH6162381.1 DUF6113 family protein [Streptomyces marispadix]